MGAHTALLLSVSALALAGCSAAASTAPTRATAPATSSSTTATSSTAAATTRTATATTAGAAGVQAPVPSAAPSGSSVFAAAEAIRPAIRRWPIPYGSARRREMAAYSLRHYGEGTYRLQNPKVIVEHYTESATGQSAFNTFAPDVPDNEFHELPNTCAHFLVEPSGRIEELVALALRCRHTTGLNWTAIGIENVGFSDAQILGDRAQLRASLALTRWLRCRYAIALGNVIGHNESLSSPYHHDRVPAFAHQTHSDWNRADMTRYRTLLARLPCPR